IEADIPIQFSRRSLINSFRLQLFLLEMPKVMNGAELSETPIPLHLSMNFILYILNHLLIFRVVFFRVAPAVTNVIQRAITVEFHKILPGNLAVYQRV